MNSAEPVDSLTSSPHFETMQGAPVTMAVRVPLQGISMRRLRSLRLGDVLASEWPAAEEVLLSAGGVALSWCEFAVVDDVIAARLTRLG